MCSYNRVNNSFACQNSKTLNGLLKTELGFQVSFGLPVSPLLALVHRHLTRSAPVPLLLRSSYRTEATMIDWDLQGYVMTDWGALHAGYHAPLAGLDMAMPSGAHLWGPGGQTLGEAIRNASLPTARLDDMATR